MIKKISYYIALFLIIISITINIVIGLLGISTIYLTISVYILILFIVLYIIKISKISRSLKINLKIFFTVFTILSFSTELTLKYVLKYNLTYLEQNGSMLYISMYKSKYLEMFYNKFFLKQDDIQSLTHEPNSKDSMSNSEFSYLHQYNSVGLRDEELIIDKNNYSIIGLGDSFTEGVGSPQDSTWLKLLEHNLNSINLTSTVKTINGGISSSDPFIEYMILSKKLIQYSPDMVIVAINRSDIDDVITGGGFERFDKSIFPYKYGPWWEFFYSYSYIFRSAMNSIFNINFLLLTEKKYEIEKKVAINKLAQCVFDNFKYLANQKKFKLVVVLHPIQYEIEEKEFLLNQLDEIFSSDSSITTINLYNEYNRVLADNKIEVKDLYWKIDRHHNSKGYKLWADILTEKVSSLIKNQK